MLLSVRRWVGKYLVVADGGGHGGASLGLNLPVVCQVSIHPLSLYSS